jgi:hypothetical protein
VYRERGYFEQRLWISLVCVYLGVELSPRKKNPPRKRSLLYCLVVLGIDELVKMVDICNDLEVFFSLSDYVGKKYLAIVREESDDLSWVGLEYSLLPWVVTLLLLSIIL